MVWMPVYCVLCIALMCSFKIINIIISLEPATGPEDPILNLNSIRCAKMDTQTEALHAYA